MRFRFPHSHAFPHGRVVVEDDDRPGPACLVDFADGTVVIAEYETAGDAIVLRVPAYRTAKGHEVEGRTWRLAKGADGGWRSARASG